MRIAGIEYVTDLWPALAETIHTDPAVEMVRLVAVRAANNGTLSKRQAVFLIRDAAQEAATREKKQ